MRRMALVIAAVVAAGCGSGGTTGAGGGSASGGGSGTSGGGAGGAGGAAGGGAGGAAGGGTGGSAGGGSGGSAGGGSGGAAGGGAGGGGAAGGGAGGGGAAGGGIGGGSAGGGAGGGVAGTPYVYVGSGNGVVSIYTLNPATGALTNAGTVNAGPNPSFLAADPQRKFMYAVNEAGGNSAIAAFAINPATGMLTPLNSRPSQGNGPAHVWVDATGRWVMGANYGGGSVAIFPVLADGGGLGPPSDTDNSGANAHQILTDPSNRYVVVPCLGTNQVKQYVFNADAGTITNNAVPFLQVPAGSGPRHLAFHPNGKWAYLINETASTMQALDFDVLTGQLTSKQSLTTLPLGFSGNNTTAEVFVHPNGKWLYGSNRGHNSIVVFALDAVTGTMTLAGHTLTGGNTPRSFAIDPGGTVLLAANQTSGTVTSFRIDPDAGTLMALGQSKAVNQPSYVGVITLP